MNRDIVAHVDKDGSSIDPGIFTATETGAIIDTQGFDSAMVLLAVGTVTDGTHTMTLEDGDDSGLSDAATVSGTDMDGTLAALASDTNQSAGYLGGKRYLRIVNTVTGSPTTGAELCGLILRGNPNVGN